MALRLSEAIRLGSMLHKQGFGSLYTYSGDQVTTCALGAAGAAGYDIARTMHAREDALACDVCGFVTDYLDTAIAHLNDAHKWTREKIADWVETIEPADPVQADDLPASQRCGGLEETGQPVLTKRA